MGSKPAVFPTLSPISEFSRLNHSAIWTLHVYCTQLLCSCSQLCGVLHALVQVLANMGWQLSSSPTRVTPFEVPSQLYSLVERTAVSFELRNLIKLMVVLHSEPARLYVHHS